MEVKLPEPGFVTCYHSNGSMSTVPAKAFAKVALGVDLKLADNIVPKYVSIKQAAKIYSTSEKFMRTWASKMGAIKPMGSRRLVCLEKVDRILEYS